MENELETIAPSVLEKIRSQLVVPRKIECRIADSTHSEAFWLVYDEEPTSSVDGYVIVFDPARETFGLAVKSRDPNSKFTFIGLYGTFKQTLEGM